MNNQLLGVILVLALINIIAFIVVGQDKSKSVHGDLRTPEVYFFVWSVFFGAVGILIGMFVFHHKTRKLYFTLGLGFLLIQQIALIWLLSLLAWKV